MYYLRISSIHSLSHVFILLSLRPTELRVFNSPNKPEQFYAIRGTRIPENRIIPGSVHKLFFITRSVRSRGFTIEWKVSSLPHTTPKG